VNKYNGPTIADPRATAVGLHFKRSMIMIMACFSPYPTSTGAARTSPTWSSCYNRAIILNESMATEQWSRYQLEHYFWQARWLSGRALIRAAIPMTRFPLSTSLRKLQQSPFDVNVGSVVKHFAKQTMFLLTAWRNNNKRKQYFARLKLLWV